jgi:hypothetical protein
MAFSQEIKDFVTGFKTGHDLITSKEDRDLKAAHARYYNSLADRTRSPTDADLGVIPDDGSGSGGHVTTGFDNTRKALSSQQVRDAALARFNFAVNELGWSPAAAAGAVGNVHAESAFNSRAQGDKNTALSASFSGVATAWTALLKSYARANNLDPQRLADAVAISCRPRKHSQMPGFEGADAVHELQRTPPDSSRLTSRFTLNARKARRPATPTSCPASAIEGCSPIRCTPGARAAAARVSNPQLTRPHHAPAPDAGGATGATGATGSTSTTPATAPAKTSGLTPGVSYAALDDQDENDTGDTFGDPGAADASGDQALWMPPVARDAPDEEQPDDLCRCRWRAAGPIAQRRRAGLPSGSGGARLHGSRHHHERRVHATSCRREFARRAGPAARCAELVDRYEPAHPDAEQIVSAEEESRCRRSPARAGERRALPVRRVLRAPVP